jgi:riboflavin synthase
MFSGIVQAVGSVRSVEACGGDVRMLIDAATLGLAAVARGECIWVAGVGLTAIEIADDCFSADVSTETLACTTLGALVPGAAVNLEKSLRLSDRLGGHLVSGHVDGVGRVLSIEDDARSQRWTIALAPQLARYVAGKGSVCVDGVSLTVNGAGDDRFDVNLIPHTLAVTTFAGKRVGDDVNIEVDLVARYVERLVSGER